jgi:alpha-mannosidase
MSLTPEWRARVEQWRRVLGTLLYRPLGEVEMKGFVTSDRLSVGQAADGPFQPMPAGTKWGAKWECGWFKGKVVLPRAAAGKRIVLRLDVGGDSAVYVNGRAAGARDREHQEVALTRSGVAEEAFKILAEAYAGHGATPCGGGPVPHGVESVPEPPPAQRAVGRSTYGVWEEEAYQLWMDVETLLQLRDKLDADSLRVAEIDQALRDFTVAVDLELPHEDMMRTVRAGRRRLKPLLDCRNGSTAPLLFAFGHAHLDVAWLWPLAETERKCVRTVASQLALMEEYPEYRYLQSQAVLLDMLKARHPDLYARVKEAAKAGRLIPEGSTWVEMDTNITGGESLIRQFIHGKRFFREEFGVDTELLWLPDVFGYSGALPQIMLGCGVKYFSTAKIFWNYHGGDPFPYNTFTWEGIDGSKVLVHLCNDYSSRTGPADVISRWRERRQKDGISTRLMPFGWGDGGGGPTRNHLEFLRREKDLEGVPRVKQASPMAYFKDLEARGAPDASYVGELYYQCHRGTYTSQARTKRGNRTSEFALREAEMWGAAASALKGFVYPAPRMESAWKRLLLNQFHDVLPGSSIRRVYEEAEAAFASVIKDAGETATAAASTFSDGDPGAVTTFNSLSWERMALVPMPEGAQGAADARGNSLTVQEMDGRRMAEVTVPPCGWTSVRTAARGPAVHNTVDATRRLLENEFLRVEFNARGEITSILDKETERELAAGPCNSFRMYKDVPAAFDAWDIDSMYPLTPLPLEEEAQIEVLADGPLAAAVRVTRQLAASAAVQVVSLRRHSRRLDFQTAVDWQESHRLLKVNFPVALHANEGIHEIQFGHIRRPNHRSRPFDADRFEVCNHKWTALAEEDCGFAVLNDCKYGVSVDGNSINLTLLKSALAPDMSADKGRQEFTYAFYVWQGSLAASNVVREAYELNCPVLTVPGMATEGSLLRVDAPNVIIETVKLAEDGSGDLIVRLYECKRAATRCTLSTSLPVKGAALASLLEKKGKYASVERGNILLDFRPFEIKTLRLKL